MEQLDLFSSIDNRVQLDLNSDSSVKIVKVEITKKI